MIASVLQSELMTVTVNEQGQANMFAKEPEMYIDPAILNQMENNTYTPYAVMAERLNGRVAMISIMLAFVSYFTTGTLAFGLF